MHDQDSSIADLQRAENIKATAELHRPLLTFPVYRGQRFVNFLRIDFDHRGGRRLHT